MYTFIILTMRLSFQTSTEVFPQEVFLHAQQGGMLEETQVSVVPSQLILFTCLIPKGFAKLKKSPKNLYRAHCTHPSDPTPVQFCFKPITDSGVSRLGLRGGFQKSQIQVAGEGWCQ